MTHTPTSASRPNAGAATGAAAGPAARLRDALAQWRSYGGAAEPVRLLRADGTQAIWQGERETADTGGEPRFTAVEVPEELVLRASLDLPMLPAEETEEALLLHARSHSPFAADDMVWGSRVVAAGTGRHAEIAIASRRQVQEFIRGRWPEAAAAGRLPEAWAPAAAGPAIVLRGFGEGDRLERTARNRRWDAALVGVALVLLLAVAATPTLQLRLRAIEAVEAFETLMPRAAPLVAKRDEIARITERLRAGDTAAADRVDPALVMEHLTRVLPDDTYLLTLDVRKAKITMAGHTSDASVLLQRLSGDPLLKDVRAPVAVTRVPGAAKEAFTLEFTMDMQAQAARTPVTGAAPASVAFPGPAGPGPGPGPAEAPVPVPASPAAATPAPAVTTAPAAPASGGSPFAVGGSKR